MSIGLWCETGALAALTVAVALAPYFAVGEYGFVPQSRQPRHDLDPLLWYELQYPFNLHLLPWLLRRWIDVHVPRLSATGQRAGLCGLFLFHGFHQYFHVQYWFMTPQGGCFEEQRGLVCNATKAHMLVGTVLFANVLRLAPACATTPDEWLAVAHRVFNRQFLLCWYCNALLCLPVFWDTPFNRALFVSWAVAWGVGVPWHDRASLDAPPGGSSLPRWTTLA